MSFKKVFKLACEKFQEKILLLVLVLVFYSQSQASDWDPNRKIVVEFLNLKTRQIQLNTVTMGEDSYLFPVLDSEIVCELERQVKRQRYALLCVHKIKFEKDPPLLRGAEINIDCKSNPKMQASMKIFVPAKTVPLEEMFSIVIRCLPEAVEKNLVPAKTNDFVNGIFEVELM